MHAWRGRRLGVRKILKNGRPCRSAHARPHHSFFLVVAPSSSSPASMHARCRCRRRHTAASYSFGLPPTAASPPAHAAAGDLPTQFGFRVEGCRGGTSSSGGSRRMPRGRRRPGGGGARGGRTAGGGGAVAGVVEDSGWVAAAAGEGDETVPAEPG